MAQIIHLLCPIHTSKQEAQNYFANSAADLLHFRHLFLSLMQPPYGSPHNGRKHVPMLHTAMLSHCRKLYAVVNNIYLYG